MKYKFDLNIDYGQIFLEVSKKDFILGDLNLQCKDYNYLKFDFDLILNKDYYLYLQFLKFNNLFYLRNLNNNILLEHSFFHKDRIILKIKDNSFFVIFEFLNNNYLSLKKMKIKDLFFIKDLSKNYFFINDKYDLLQINDFVKCNLNLNYIDSKFFLLKFENKCHKNNVFIFSLYGFNFKENKFKFLYFFEIYFIFYSFLKINNSNQYISLNLFWKIKNIVVESILNKYYWSNNNKFNIETYNSIYDYIKLGPYDDWKLRQFFLYRKNKFENLLKKHLNKYDILTLEEFLINLKLKLCLFKYIKFSNNFVYINIIFQIRYLKSIGWKKWYGIFENTEKNILLNKENFKNFSNIIEKFEDWKL